MRKKYNSKNIIIKTIIYCLFVILLIIPSLFINRFRYDYKRGEIARQNIYANRKVEDTFETNRLKKEAEESVETVQSVNDKVLIDAKDLLNKLFEEFVLYRNNNSDLERKISTIISSSNHIRDFDFSYAQIKKVLMLSNKEFLALQSNIYYVLDNVMREGINSENAKDSLEAAKDEFSVLEIDNDKRGFANIYFKSVIKPNVYSNYVETSQLRKEKAESIKPIFLEKGDIIVAKGKMIDERELELINKCDLNSDNGTYDLRYILGIVGLIVLISLLFYVYLYKYNKEILYSNSFYILLLTFIITVLLALAASKMNNYLIPILLPVIIINTFTNGKSSLIVTTTIILYLSLYINFTKEFIIAVVIQVLILDILIRNMTEWRTIPPSVTLAGFISYSIIVLLGLIKANSFLEIAASSIILAASSLSVVIAMGLTPVFERVFNILTPFRLMKLTNTNNKILRRLSLEAPGTYHHSIMVANLVESACEAIGANSLLGKAKAYYHDLGKLYKPDHFMENLQGAPNPHDMLEPLQSTNIILHHISEGVKIAEKEKLPKEIIDGIREHHGTTLVSYFYLKSKEILDGVDISEKDFRYAGPTPKSKENTILMLADSCEAAVRSMSDFSRQSIEEMVNRVINGKIADGQLKNTELTYKDVTTLLKVFTNFFTSAYHHRVKYLKEE